MGKTVQSEPLVDEITLMKDERAYLLHCIHYYKTTSLPKAFQIYNDLKHMSIKEWKNQHHNLSTYSNTELKYMKNKDLLEYLRALKGQCRSYRHIRTRLVNVNKALKEKGVN